MSETLWTLPPTWTWVPLRDVATVESDLRDPMATPNATHIAPNHIESGTGRLLAKGCVGPDQVTSPKHAFRGGHILYSKIRPYLAKAVLVNFEGLCSADVYPIATYAGIVDPRFLHRWLVSPAFTACASESEGRTVLPKINQDALYRKPVPLPPLQEQVRIADKLEALLTRVDACRERLARVPAILDRFRQSVLAAATSGELTANWRAERRQAFDWTPTCLGVIASLGTGATPRRANKKFYTLSGTPWITSAATGNAYIRRANVFVTAEAIRAHRLRCYPPGTLLVAMYGEGKTRGQVAELQISATINQACAAVSVDETRASRHFVRLMLEAKYWQMRDLAEGGNQPNLNLSKIRTLPLLLPSLEEQHAVADRVGRITTWLDSLRSKSESVRNMADAMTAAFVAKAFRGELVPQDPNDEPAAALLARLRTERATTTPPVRRQQSTARASRKQLRA